LQTVVEGSSATPVVWGADKAAPTASTITVEPGTQEVDATVTVTYAVS
jgi:uncharacterized protein YggE